MNEAAIPCAHRELGILSEITVSRILICGTPDMKTLFEQNKYFDFDINPLTRKEFLNEWK